MKKETSIVFVCTNTSFATGQGLVNEFIFSELKDSAKDVFKLTQFSGISAFTFFIFIWNFISYLLISFRYRSTLYISPSRSGLGFIRDAPYLLFSSLTKSRTIAHIHGFDFYSLCYDRWYSNFARLLYRRCELIVPSCHLAQKLKPLGLKIHIVPSCLIDEGEVEFQAQSQLDVYDSRFTDFTIVWNSNIIASKGVFFLLEAVKLLNETGCRIKFICCGEVVARSAAERTLNSDILERFKSFDWFEYLGTVPHRVSRWLVARASLVCLPSWYPIECQGLAIVEAMVSGTPVIISKTRVLEETVGDYPHVACGKDDTASLTAAIRELYLEFHYNRANLYSNLKEPSLSARRRYCREVFVEKFLKIIDEAN